MKVLVEVHFVVDAANVRSGRAKMAEVLETLAPALPPNTVAFSAELSPDWAEKQQAFPHLRDVAA